MRRCNSHILGASASASTSASTSSMDQRNLLFLRRQGGAARVVHKRHRHHSRSRSRSISASMAKKCCSSSPSRKRGSHSKTWRATSGEGEASVLMQDEDRQRVSDCNLTLLGGKGGVGKTTLAASFAIDTAQATQQPTLIVSTDPAHSLSDALGQDVSGGAPVLVENYASLPIWALEIDPQKAKADISAKVKEETDKSSSGSGGKSPLSSITGLLKMIGVNIDPQVLENLNLGELLNSPPPGFDEVLAIAKIMDFVTMTDTDQENSDAVAAGSQVIDVGVADAQTSVDSQQKLKFSNIVIDTAPTGHTLRLLAAPELLDRSLGKVLALRKMLDGASTLVKSIFSFGQQQAAAEDLNQGQKEETLVQKIEKAQYRLRAFATLLHNDKSSEFIAVSIPTQMAVSETIDLVTTLKEEGIPIKRCVVNQVLPSDSQDGGVKLIESRQKDQTRALKMLEEDAELAKLEQLRSPLLDLEVKGVPALQYFGRGLWQESSIIQESSSCTTAKAKEQKFVIVGGKGGVGKTTSSASLALSLAQEGHTVLIVSTDPAHSLGDSVSQDVSGGQPVLLEGTDLPVWAMEINPEETMNQLRGLLKKVEDSEVKDDGTGNPAVDFGKILQKVQDLKLDELLEEPPPGTDEAIAVAKVVQFAEKPEFAKFTRIIVDTAPTGHTLRLLTLPSFISLSIDKILKFKSVITQLVGQSKGDVAIEKLEELQRQMDDAQVLFRDKDKTEFVIVGIPTFLSVAESSRLVRALQEENVLVRHLVTNQILDFHQDDQEAEERIRKFVTSKLRDQQSALERLKSDPSCSQLDIVEGPIVNMEVRGVPALQYFASIIWSSS